MTTTPQEALEWAEAHVKRMSGTGVHTGTAAERSAAALDVARFLLYGAKAADDEEYEEEAEGPVGPAYTVESCFGPGDRAYVRAGAQEGSRYVMLMLTADGEHCKVPLSPRDARMFAAGILNAADEAEGGSPLLGWVGGEDGEEPPRPAGVPA